MRTLKFLMISAALGAGLLAGQAAQAQPAIVPPYAPSYYGLNPAGFAYGTGYGYGYGYGWPTASWNNPLPYGQVGKAVKVTTKDGAVRVVNPWTGGVPWLHPNGAWDPEALAKALKKAQDEAGPGTFTTTIKGTVLSQVPGSYYYGANGAALPYYYGGQPQVVVVRDVSGLPGYGVITLPPEGFAAMPFNARDFPKVFAPIVGKKP